MQDVLGFGLAAGQGVRLQPLTLKANGYIRSKAAVRFLGERIITWLLRGLRAQGLTDAVLITRGKENRGQVKSLVEYGARVDMRLRYSPVTLEGKDSGSACALLDNLLYHHPDQRTLFVFPTDSLLEFDLQAMLAHHRSTGAAITIATATYPAEVIAGTYGMLDVDAAGRVRRFLEKPSLETIYAQMSRALRQRQALPPLFTNAGFYLMESRALREVSGYLAHAHGGQQVLDIGGDLLPWMVERGYPVQSFAIDRMGDLGNIPSYLQTMGEVLAGKFPSATPLLTAHPAAPAGTFIDPTTWAMPDPISGLSLQEKVARGLVTLHAPLRIGKYVRIDPGVTIAMSNIDDECHLQDGASVVRASVGEGSRLGPHSRLTDVIVGMMADLQSAREQPVVLADYAAVGDEVTLHAGVHLRGRINIHPRLSIPSGTHLDAPMDISSTDHLPRTPRVRRSADTHAVWSTA